MSHSLKQGEINLLIDIGSQSVGGALVVTGEKPEIIFLKRIKLPWSRVRNEEKIEEAIIQSLDDLLRIVLKEGSTALHLDEHKMETKKIKNVLCLVSSPWCKSETNLIKEESDKPFKITAKMVEEIFDKNEINTKKENSDYRLVEKKIIKAKLNGYPADDFFNKETKEIDISTFDGRILESFAQKIEKVVNHLINSEIIFHTYTLTALTTLKDIFPKSDDYMMVEVTGSKTDVTIVEDDFIEKTESFSVGTNSLLGRVSDEYNVTSDIAMSFLKIYYEKRTEENFRNRIEKVVEQEKGRWISELKSLIEKNHTPLPSKIFLMIDPNFQPFFEEYLKTCFREKNVSVVFVGSSVLGQFCNSSKNDFDPFIFLGSIFLNKMYRA